MLCFGLGTLPAMLALGLCGRSLQGLLQTRWRRLVPVCLVLLSLLLILRGLALGIPWLSPNLSDADRAKGCCRGHVQAENAAADLPPARTGARLSR